MLGIRPVGQMRNCPQEKVGSDDINILGQLLISETIGRIEAGRERERERERETRAITALNVIPVLVIT